ncbi:hypothetical protein [Limnohabitans sp. MMS-10A-178]|jgi:hypothetical protein|uniref:hypothetical protein n=1 Tax=Limnohabitans sp. MMS-10A-178 TaxID=1835767 RepID=UPI000D353FE4|nr:hypothetical protein [Limnohabitans sp. MMS-10A-178]PUE16234.1 hypothetical protein B9Z32_01025 [Limnohabitans sp. MMS-10A-178]
MKLLKLRWLILVLLFLNGLFYIWQEGAFKAWGWAPPSAREPERTTQQINPDHIEIKRKTP